jgi:type IV pilus assembly protein PilC
MAKPKPWTYRVFIVTYRGKSRDVDVFSPAGTAATRFAVGAAEDEEITEKRLDRSDAKFRAFWTAKTATPTELENFFLGLARSMARGADFRQALDLVVPMCETPYFRGVIAGLYEGRTTSSSYASLFGEFPGAFNNVALGMIKEGDASGKHDVVFERLATMSRHSSTLKREVVNGMVYPGIVMILLLVGIVVVNVYILPSIIKNFDTFHATLPPMTAVLISVMKFTSKNPWVGFVPLILGGWVIWKRSWFYAQPLIQKLIVRLPILGDLMRKIILSRSFRTLAVLYDTGVFQKEAFGIAAGVAGQVEYEAYLRAIPGHLAQGKLLHEAFMRERFWIGREGKRIADQLKVASITGNPASILTRIADLYDEEAMTAAKNFPKVVEPVLIVIILFCVGLLCAAIYLPNFYLVTEALKQANSVGAPP